MNNGRTYKENPYHIFPYQADLNDSLDLSLGDLDLTLSDKTREFSALQGGDLFLESASQVDQLIKRTSCHDGSLRVVLDVQFTVPVVTVEERGGRNGELNYSDQGTKILEYRIVFACIFGCSNICS